MSFCQIQRAKCNKGLLPRLCESDSFFMLLVQNIVLVVVASKYEILKCLFVQRKYLKEEDIGAEDYLRNRSFYLIMNGTVVRK